MRRLAPTSSARERSRVNVSPVLALAGLAAIGLLATQLPRPPWRRVASLDPVVAAGGPPVVVGLVLGPGLGLGGAAPLRRVRRVSGAPAGRGLGELVARRIARVAVLETAAGALAITLPLWLHRPPAASGAGGAELGWLASLVFAVGSGALVGMAFLSISRLRPAPAGLGFALLATLAFGAGLGYAADLPPFVVCALGAALI